MKYHKSDMYVMRGSGIGSFFSNIFKNLIPFATKILQTGVKVSRSEPGKRILQAAKKSALNAGLDIAHDTLKGENVKQSARKNLKKAGKDFAQNIGEEIARKRLGGAKKKGRGKKGARGVYEAKKGARKTKGKCKTINSNLLNSWLD